MLHRQLQDARRCQRVPKFDTPYGLMRQQLSVQSFWWADIKLLRRQRRHRQALLTGLELSHRDLLFVNQPGVELAAISRGCAAELLTQAREKR